MGMKISDHAAGRDWNSDSGDDCSMDRYSDNRDYYYMGLWMGMVGRGSNEPSMLQYQLDGNNMRKEEEEEWWWCGAVDVDWKADAVDTAVRAMRVEKRYRSNVDGAMILISLCFVPWIR